MSIGMVIVFSSWACLGCAYLSDNGVSEAKSDAFIMTVVGVAIEGLSIYWAV